MNQNITRLERRRDQLKTALQADEQTLKNKIERELVDLKNRKSELFQITEQDQLAKLTTQLATSIIRWLIE